MEDVAIYVAEISWQIEAYPDEHISLNHSDYANSRATIGKTRT